VSPVGKRGVVVETVDRGGNIAGHGNVESAVGVVPRKGYSTVDRRGVRIECCWGPRVR
jgi:hypothetical protein